MRDAPLCKLYSTTYEQKYAGKYLLIYNYILLRTILSTSVTSPRYHVLRDVRPPRVMDAYPIPCRGSHPSGGPPYLGVFR